MSLLRIKNLKGHQYSYHLRKKNNHKDKSFYNDFKDEKIKKKDSGVKRIVGRMGIKIRDIKLIGSRI